MERARPGRRFPRFAENRWPFEKFQTSRLDNVVRSAEREARTTTPVAGMLPNFGSLSLLLFRHRKG